MTDWYCQLRRTKRWRKPKGVIIGDRRTEWGNPYRIGRDVSDAERAANCFRADLNAAMRDEFYLRGTR